MRRRMTLRLRRVTQDNAVAELRADVKLNAEAGAVRELRYHTRTGALLRIDGMVRGAFDREHGNIRLPGALQGAVVLEVERRSLPTKGLPSGDGLLWRWMLARARARPAPGLRSTVPSTRPARRGAPANRTPSASHGGARELALVGHSHLDVAWLWTYAEAARKAVRTFATVVRQLELDPDFIFTQSQPQLYAFVRDAEPELFARVAAFARAGRFDASGAALWVESDANLPSGESLLRQLVFGMRFAQRELGTTPSVAWLPDSFGFANTVPTLLAHAGVHAFGTTKLGWNDTTPFPHAQFLWEGPDGSRVVAAQIASIAGAFAPLRVRRARERGDLLLVGEGDGGGGAPDAALAAAPRFGRWTTLGGWFERVAANSESLPVVRDELYLEEHRGTATTHHDVKAGNAALERTLRDAEEALAWAYALRATPFFLDEAREQLRRAWEIVLRAQFHDVLPGTAIAPVYADTFASYDEAQRLVAHVASGARSVLPTVGYRSAGAAGETVRFPSAARGTGCSQLFIAPSQEGDAYAFVSEMLVARLKRDGTIVELRIPGGPNLVRAANRLALYADRPRRWDAWNLDRSYRRRPRRLRATSCAVVDGALEIRYALGASLAVARVSLASNEPFLRVELAVAWQERHALLRCENALAFAATRARFGAPHGAVDRAVVPRTPAERSKYEAVGQRFARIDGAQGGLAMLALDTYGWSVTSAGDATQLGHSLLRAPRWPDPGADRGEHAFSLAYVPFSHLGMGQLEALWERFAREPSVAMFFCDDPAVLITAVKLADDGDGIIVRARECDGGAREARLQCGVRARNVQSVDAHERPVSREAALADGGLVAAFTPYELRSFRVQVR